MISEEVNTLINTYEKMCEKYTFDSLFRIRQDEMKLILGLIANLQQENQSLKQQCEIVEKRLCDEYQDMLEKRNKLFVETSKLKDRIEKAEEYINKIELDNYDTYIANILLDRNDDLLEILKGDK